MLYNIYDRQKKLAPIMLKVFNEMVSVCVTKATLSSET